MRLLLLAVVFLFTLSGCVNYSGLQSEAKIYSEKHLSIPHFYKAPHKPSSPLPYVIPRQANYKEWWKKFNDPQLDNLIKIGLRDSPDLQSAKDRLRKAQAVTSYSAAALWPTINLRGYEVRERISLTGLIPPPFNGKTFNITELGLNFNYEFDFWGKHREKLAASISRECAAYAEVAQARLILSTSIAATYFQLQSNILQLKNAQAILHQQQALLRIIKNRTQHGIESDIPVRTAEVNKETASLAVTQYKQAVEITYNFLAALIGKNPLVTKVEIPKPNFNRYQFRLPHVLLASLLANRPDVLASRYRVEALAHEINVSKAAFFPNINLLGLFSYQSIFFRKLFERQNQNNLIGGAIDLPIFDAGAKRANLNGSYVDYDLSVNEYNQTLINALREVADQLSILKNLKAQLKIKNQAIKATVSNIRLVKARYQHGLVDYEKILEFTGLLFQQQSILIDLQTQHLKAIVALYKALGGYD